MCSEPQTGLLLASVLLIPQTKHAVTEYNSPLSDPDSWFRFIREVRRSGPAQLLR